jgi:DNA-directed RNA polymerase subunit RPC12/RpoP|tara:strand:- start:6 stop:197 length:192 start_codon:yes stop_codon:yes gene_type:complete
MNCWHCKTELIWGGDHDIEDSEDFIMETNLACPNCNSLVYVLAAKHSDGFCFSFDDETAKVDE